MLRNAFSLYSIFYFPLGTTPALFQTLHFALFILRGQFFPPDSVLPDFFSRGILDLLLLPNLTSLTVESLGPLVSCLAAVRQSDHSPHQPQRRTLSLLDRREQT